MKEKMLKLTSIITVFCIIATMIIPSMVKSAQAVVSNMYNTYHGIGNTSVFSVSVKGYSNLYCANGGAPLNNGTVLNDDGTNMYNSKSISDVTTKQNALNWIFDNMYLVDVTDASIQKAMKTNLKNAIKKYSNYKDSNGNYILSKKIGVSNINDDWINTAVESLISDKTTLFVVQQYAIWHYVNNSVSAYGNAMQNSDGTYNAIPNAKADRTYYTALYISLTGLADQAQKNGYVSPNTKGDPAISLQRASNGKVTIQSDGKTALIGPYKLANNTSVFGKSLSATVNSNEVDKVETVDENGKAVSIKETQSEFYVKVTYNKGFEKGTKYNFKINVKISGYKTFATLLRSSQNTSQPLITVRKEAYNANSADEISYMEELKGNYSLVLEKVDSKNSNTKIPGVTFKVKEGDGEAKTYGPTDSKGTVTVLKDKAITKEGVDEYTITEVDVGDNEYIKLKDEVKIYITTSKSNNAYIASKVSFEKDKETTSKEVTLEDNSKVTLTSQISDNTVKITVPNKPDLKGKYTLVLEKINSIYPHLKIPGVTFKVKEGDGEAKTYGPTEANGMITIFKDKEIKEKGVKEYTITEVDLGDNEYIKIKEEIKVYITISEQDNVLVPSKVSFDKDKEVTSKEVSLEDGTKVTVTALVYGSKILIDIPNKPILKGKYSLELEKVDSEDQNKKLSGVTFKVKEGDGEAKTYGPTDENGLVTVIKNKEVREEKIEEYTITEVEVGSNKYLKLKEEIKVYVTISKADAAYVASKVSFDKDNEVTSKEATLEDGTKVTVTSQISGNTVKITVPNKQATFDLALRKFITKVNGEELETSREPKITLESATVLRDTGTAIYNNPKDSITVKEGDTVTYKIRIYNEGYIDGYAKEITDYLPSGLEFVEDSNLNKENGWTATINEDGTTTVKTTKLADTVISASKGAEGYQKLVAGMNESEDWVDFWKDVEIECKVKGNVKGNLNLSNVAEITNYGYMDGENYIEANKEDVDRDSEEDNVFDDKNKIQSNIDEYYESQYGDGDKDNYPGKQDDDDFENLYVEQKDFDLALRKFITKVNGEELETSREPEITLRSVTVLKATGTAKYNHPKNPITVKEGDTVTYTIRIYNEGYIDGYAKEITDYLPSGLEFIEDSELNKENGWIATINEDGTTTVKTTKLTDTQIRASNGPEGYQELVAGMNKSEDWVEFWKDVEIECKVKESDEGDLKLSNVAEITNYGYMDGEDYVEANKEDVDRDSEENNVFDDKNKIENSINEYYESQYGNGDKEYYPGKQDDDDFENLYIEPKAKEFDLALRKFITELRTGVGSKEEKKQEITDREPVFTVDEDGNYIYEHTKEPLVVANDNIVIYTLRVYNEGEVDGYAEQIKDDIPEGLEFLPSYSVNEEYRWKMIDKYGKETTNVQDAESIVSDYLSKEQEQSPEENLLKAFDIEAYKAGEIKEPSYKEVKVAFQVTTDEKSEEIIINQAQISDDSDKDENEVTDKDSTPDEWIEGEDDQDIEKIKVQYFDLSLRKWVTKAIVTENGNQTITETGHKAEDNPEEIVKVDLEKSKINDVTVKFEYSIRVKNEGKIAGYAKEISDYIPEGLKFVKEDNPDWEEAEGKVVTDKLKDTLLKPGDTAEVTIVLTWVNSEENMGLKTNTAEISEDYNEYDSPDIDSTPDNKEPGEDDIDDAPVMLTIKTGQVATYAGVILVVLIMIAGGMVCIKKFVLK